MKSSWRSRAMVGTDGKSRRVSLRTHVRYVNFCRSSAVIGLSLSPRYIKSSLSSASSYFQNGIFDTLKCKKRGGGEGLDSERLHEDIYM